MITTKITPNQLYKLYINLAILTIDVLLYSNQNYMIQKFDLKHIIKYNMMIEYYYIMAI